MLSIIGIAILVVIVAILPNLVSNNIEEILKGWGYYKLSAINRLVILLPLAILLSVMLIILEQSNVSGPVNPLQTGGGSSPTSTADRVSSPTDSVGGVSTDVLSDSENTISYINSRPSSDCYGDYARPEFAIFAVARKTSVNGEIPLLPIPSDDTELVENPALFPKIHRDQILGIIGRSPNSFGAWLYIQVEEQGAVTRQGFVRLENTTYSGVIDSLPIVEIPACPSSG